MGKCSTGEKQALNQALTGANEGASMDQGISSFHLHF